MQKQPTLENLNVLSNFMMNAIATDEDYCEPFFREVLSILLDCKIGEISVRAQSIKPGITPDLRGICLDVEIYETLNNAEIPAKCRLYDIEPQLYHENNLQKRNRFYQAKKDSKGLRRGEKDWSKLPDLYMIMISNFDPFGMDNVVYTFENKCVEFPELPYNDGLKFIYFNTVGKNGGTKAIRELLSYLNCSKIENVTNDSIAHIHNYVTTIKQSEKVRDDYMTLGDLLDHYAEQAYETARLEYARELLLDILSSFEHLPEDFKTILQDADEATLKNWIKLAAQASSIEEFFTEINYNDK